jgi:chaperonin GroEL (HSP60 family)
MAEELRDVKVALVNKAFDTKPVELLMPGKGPFSIKLEVTDQGQIQRFKAEERRMDDDLVAAVVASGARVVVCRAKITDAIADQMSRMGILAFEMIDQADMDAVGEATGARAIGDVKNLHADDLGEASRVRVERIEAIDYVRFEAEKGSTFLLRGSSVSDAQELERVVQNAVRVMGTIRKDARAAWGGGATYMRVATRLREYALDFPGKEQMAILAFADAVEQIPGALIGNFGLSYSKVLPELRSYHARGTSSMGIGPQGVTDMDGEVGVRDLVLTHKMLLARAYEVARLLLRIDEYIYAKELPLFHKK